MFLKKSLESRKVIQAFFLDFLECHQEKGMLAHVHILHEGLCSCPVSDGASANYYSRDYDYETTILLTYKKHKLNNLLEGLL